MSQEEKLKKIYNDFAEDIKKVADKALYELITDYIPHAETDLEMNVFSYSRQLIKDFLTDKPTYDWHYNIKEIFKDINSEEVRRKLIEEYREEIINDIIQDQEKEIERLKSHIKWQDSILESRFNRIN